MTNSELVFRLLEMLLQEKEKNMKTKLEQSNTKNECMK